MFGMLSVIKGTQSVRHINCSVFRAARSASVELSASGVAIFFLFSFGFTSLFITSVIALFQRFVYTANRLRGKP